jgi:TolB-like protein/Flp pilus assembly protein TadD/tRNA A-37 threonylcarbamoyl transferase component Bud32
LEGFAPDLREQLQRTLGDNYTIERELGGGGMSRVFVAEETSLGRKVVVKVLPPDLAATVNVERFRREIQLAAKLQHPHIVPVLAAGISDGLPYYTMPFVEGESLRARLARSGELPVQEAVKILRDVLSALWYAHDHGVVHRDIKPDNVLLTGQHAVVADFGVAKALSASTNAGSSLTSLGVALGTPAYMSPEQAAADPTTDHRADIYGLGAMAYEMLTGHQVFSARSPQAMLAAHATEKPEPIERRRPAVPPALSSLIMRALEKHAADRPQSAAEMLADLEAAVTPSGATVPVPRSTGGSGVSRRAKVAAWVVLGITIIAVAIYASGSSRRLAGTTEESSAQAAKDSIHTVAVIPFANTGGNPQDEYFSDGMTDELAHALSRLPRLRVAGRTSSFAFKGKSMPAQEIGKALNVSAIVDGSVRRAGDRLRVIAQLTSTTDGQVIWSATYESRAKDVFALQDEFTNAIVGALAPALSGAKASTVASQSRGTNDQAAYDLYLKGKYFSARPGSGGLRRALDYFEQALTKDSMFARAHAGLSLAATSAPLFGVKVPGSGDSLALANANSAIRIDPSLGDAHLALAYALSAAWRFRDAEVEFQRTLQLQPDDPLTHSWHGDNMEPLGRIKEAVSEHQRAESLDPLSTAVQGELGYALYINGQSEASIPPLLRALELNATTPPIEDQLALSYLFSGQAAKAIPVIERSYSREPDLPGTAGILTLVYAALGRWSDATRIEKLVSRSHNSAMDRFLVRSAFGDRAGAWAVFEKLTRQDLFGWVFSCDPVFRLVQDDPRFLAMLKRYGMVRCPLVEWPIRPPPPEFAVNH